jgi:phosphotriesterase-related protein
MTTINSVLGPLDTADLGFTLMHEHLLVAAGGVYRDYPELLGPNKMERLIQRLKEAKEGGIDTIVDCTTLDLGRNVELLAEAARKSGMNIIACAGWWLDVPRFFEGVTPDQMAALFVREIEQGISGTSIKAGILKSASDMFGVTPEQEVMLRAVARAHLETGVPIIVHSYPAGQVGREQIAILKEEGVDLARVKLDHSNDTTDVEYLTWLMEQGCYLGMDRYPGRNVSPSARTRTLKALMDAGYTDRLCPSHDGITLRVNPDTPGILPTEEEMKTINPHGYLYIKKIVFAQLREMGISEDLLNRLCVTAPKNFFEG